MITGIVCLTSLGYGLGYTLRLWKKRMKREAILLLLLTVLTTGYYVPATVSYWPNVEGVNRLLFKPVSDYVLGLLHIRPEEL